MLNVHITLQYHIYMEWYTRWTECCAIRTSILKQTTWFFDTHIQRIRKTKHMSFLAFTGCVYIYPPTIRTFTSNKNTIFIQNEYQLKRGLIWKITCLVKHGIVGKLECKYNFLPSSCVWKLKLVVKRAAAAFVCFWGFIL